MNGAQDGDVAIQELLSGVGIRVDLRQQVRDSLVVVIEIDPWTTLRNTLLLARLWNLVRVCMKITTEANRNQMKLSFLRLSVS